MVRRGWTDVRWDWWARIYDPVTKGLERGRRRAIELANLQSGESVLLPGAGTGLDLPLLPYGVSITVIEQSPVMLERLRERASRLGLPVTIIEGDASATDLPSGSFDVVLLHLILAVADSPAGILTEAKRLTRPGGRIVVLDKFAPDEGSVSVARRLANRMSRVLATDITLRLGPLANGAGLTVHERSPAALGGLFETAVLK